MEIKKFEPSMINDVINLWNESVCPHSVYAPFSAETFRAKFLDNPHFDEDGLLVAEGRENNRFRKRRIQ